jgi:hypothetical protein
MKKLPVFLIILFLLSLTMCKKKNKPVPTNANTSTTSGQQIDSFDFSYSNKPMPFEATTFKSTLPDSVEVEWQFGDGKVSYSPKPAHTYRADSVFTVSLKAYNKVVSKQIKVGYGFRELLSKFKHWKRQSYFCQENPYYPYTPCLSVSEEEVRYLDFVLDYEYEWDKYILKIPGNDSTTKFVFPPTKTGLLFESNGVLYFGDQPGDGPNSWKINMVTGTASFRRRVYYSDSTKKGYYVADYFAL